MYDYDNVYLSTNFFRPIKHNDWRMFYQNEDVICVYVALRILAYKSYINMDGRAMIEVTSADICKALGITGKLDKYYSKIKNGLEILKTDIVDDYHFIEVVMTKNKKWLIDVTNLKVDVEIVDDKTEMANTSLFFKVPIEYIQRIGECSGVKFSRWTYIYTYTMLCSTIDIDSLVGMTSHEVMLQRMKMKPTDNHTLIARYQKFVDLGIIVFGRTRFTKTIDDEYITLSKVYCLPEHVAYMEYESKTRTVLSRSGIRFDEANKKGGIYCIKLDNKVYVGQTHDFVRRLQQHISIKKRHDNKPSVTYDIINNEQSIVRILEYCDEKILRLEKEREWTKYYMELGFDVLNGEKLFLEKIKSKSC